MSHDQKRIPAMEESESHDDVPLLILQYMIKKCKHELPDTYVHIETPQQDSFGIQKRSPKKGNLCMGREQSGCTDINV